MYLLMHLQMVARRLDQMPALMLDQMVWVVHLSGSKLIAGQSQLEDLLTLEEVVVRRAFEER